jgi:hypothetical protein
MSTNKIKAGEAFILIRAIDKTAPVLQKVSQRFDQVGANIRNFGLVIGGIGAAITGVFIKPLKVASEVTEQQNKFFQVFGTHDRPGRRSSAEGHRPRDRPIAPEDVQVRLGLRRAAQRSGSHDPAGGGHVQSPGVDGRGL